VNDATSVHLKTIIIEICWQTTASSAFLRCQNSGESNKVILSNIGYSITLRVTRLRWDVWNGSVS